MSNITIKQSGTRSKEVHRRILTLILSYEGYRIHCDAISIDKFIDSFYDDYHSIRIQREKKLVDGNNLSSPNRGEVLTWPQDAAKLIEYLDSDNNNITSVKVGDYDSVINYNNKVLVVGCQTIPFAKIDELHTLIHSKD
jgi:hypothetical protein